MFPRSWPREADNGTNQSRQHHPDRKQTFGNASCNEKLDFESQLDLLRGFQCHRHPSGSECASIKRRVWLHRARWCLLIVPLYFFYLRPWTPPSADFTVSRHPVRPPPSKPKPHYAMSNYSTSALRAHSAYGVSNAHGLNVHVNAVVPNVTRMFIIRMVFRVFC